MGVKRKSTIPLPSLPPTNKEDCSGLIPEVRRMLLQYMKDKHSEQRAEIERAVRVVG